MPKTNGLGIDYDLSTGFAPVDMSTAANTGKRLNMQFVKSVDIVLIKAAGTAGDDPVITVKAHSAASSGSSADLDVVTSYHVKAEATLDGDETWTTVSQTAGDITDPGGAGTSAEEQQIVVFNVCADQMPSDKPYLSVDVADVGTNAQLGTLLYIIHHHDKKAPADLRVPLR